MVAKRVPVKKASPKAPRNLDLACGQRKQDGFTGIDIAGKPDITHDLLRTPWPIRANTVEETFCSHFVEHIPHYRPEFKGRDGWFVFFDELWRVCKPGAKCVFLHPYVKCDRAFWDPTHVRFIHETTWYYLDRSWRELQGLDHYPVKCDFEVVVISGTGLADEFATRPADFQNFARQHYWNAIPDLHVELKARK